MSTETEGKKTRVRRSLEAIQADYEERARKIRLRPLLKAQKDFEKGFKLVLEAGNKAVRAEAIAATRLAQLTRELQDVRNLLIGALSDDPRDFSPADAGDGT